MARPPAPVEIGKPRALFAESDDRQTKRRRANTAFESCPVPPLLVEQRLPPNATVQNVVDQTRRSIARPTWHGNSLRIQTAWVNAMIDSNHVPFACLGGRGGHGIGAGGYGW